jgi:hypothetical protein
MSDEITQERLASSCNKLSEVSTDLPNVSVWLDTEDVEQCNNLIGRNTEEICEFEKNTFGLERRNNSRKFKRKKLDFQTQYDEYYKQISEYEAKIQQSQNNRATNLQKNSVKALYQGAYTFINGINRETENLKNKIVDTYPVVEGSQYKDLLVNYKKIKDNMDKIETVKEETDYLEKRLDNKSSKLSSIKNVNLNLKISIGVFFVIGIILALLFRFL